MTRASKFMEQIEDVDKGELELYIENDEQLYKQQLIPIIKNILTKMQKGVYDHSLSPKLWQYLVDEGGRKYIKEFGSPGDKLQNIFPASMRRELAQEFADKYKQEIELGNYDNLLPGFSAKKES
jgi:hypothetical protein